MHPHASSGSRAGAGFTLAEVLAALVFMAIVIPVAVEGLRLASQAGQVAQRKAVALRLAEQVLQQQIVTGEWLQNSQGGTIKDGPLSYRWRLQAEPWVNGVLRLLTVSVTFSVQNQEQDLRLSTLVDTPTQTTNTTTSSTSSTSTR